jgi:SNF2 family DNA or RNA helicase
MTKMTQTHIPYLSVVETKKGFKDLYDSQQRGVDHLYGTDFTQFVAPMGYGKTAVAMTAIGELIVDGEISCALVVAPKRVAQLVWPKEKGEWTHLQKLRVVTVDGTPEQRLKKLFRTPGDIFVVGIDLIPWLCNLLKPLADDHPLFQLLVIDESSRLKNARGVWSKAMRKIAPRFKMRWGLTGTPRPNGYLDQFGPLSVITADKLWGRSYDRWREEHFMATDYQRRNWEIRQDHIPRVEMDIRRYTATVDPSDLADVPELVVRDHWVELPEDIMDDYRRMERKLVAEIGDDVVVAANAGVSTIKLAQMVQGFLYNEDKSALWIHDAKLDVLKDMIEKLDGAPALIAYEFQEDLARLRTVWPELRWLGAGTSDSQAAQNEADWNAGRLPLLALHPAAAGHGLNLQHGGHQLIWYGMTWSAELYDQTIKRIHRQGQKERCFIHRILARHTLDEAKVLRVEQKITSQEAFKRYLRRV